MKKLKKLEKIFNRIKKSIQLLNNCKILKDQYLQNFPQNVNALTLFNVPIVNSQSISNLKQGNKNLLKTLPLFSLENWTLLQIPRYKAKNVAAAQQLKYVILVRLKSKMTLLKKMHLTKVKKKKRRSNQKKNKKKKKILKNHKKKKRRRKLLKRKK